MQHPEGEFWRVSWYERGAEFGNPKHGRRFRVNAPEVSLHPEYGHRKEARENGLMQIKAEEDLFSLCGAVADHSRKTPGQAETIAAQYNVRGYTSGVEMLEKEPLDAVSICTAPHQREELIKAAAQNNVALFIEKPWAANLAEAQRLADLCHELNVRVMTGFSFRFHPAVVRLRALMDTELGAGWLLGGEYVFGWVPPAESWLWDPKGGGEFFNENSCHLFDVVCHLLGRPVSVMAKASAPQGTPSENRGAVVVRFENGALATLSIGGVGTGGMREFPRLNIACENGQAHLTGREHLWKRLHWSVRGDDTVHDLLRAPEALGDTRYSAAFRHFIECVRTGAAPSATIADGVQSVALAEAIYQSARTGTKVMVERH